MFACKMGMLFTSDNKINFIEFSKKLISIFVRGNLF